MENVMDRRQRKSREAILGAFTELLSKKKYDKITVGEIIERADVGRATFYAHFETKDFLLKALCEELFCHIFDTSSRDGREHRHIFSCDSHAPVFLHLFSHLAENDHKKAWGYGNAATSYEEFYERYAGLTDALLDNPRMIGFCYTQLTDVEQELNGIYNYDRSEKFDSEVLYKINMRKAAIEK